MKEYGLGRLPAIDDRDQKYLIRAAVPTLKSTKTKKYWWGNGWWGNQEQTPQCVAYASIHFLEDGAITHKKVPPPMLDPKWFYDQCQANDEWEGSNYDGTSVRAAMKVLKQNGLISEYQWAFDYETMLYTLLEVSPVIVGVNWYSSMDHPDDEGIVRVSGTLRGGHAFEVNGTTTIRGLHRCKQSWGRENYGKNGYFYIPDEDFDRLINEGGEIALPIEIPDAA